MGQPFPANTVACSNITQFWYTDPNLGVCFLSFDYLCAPETSPPFTSRVPPIHFRRTTFDDQCRTLPPGTKYPTLRCVRRGGPRGEPQRRLCWRARQRGPFGSGGLYPALRLWRPLPGPPLPPMAAVPGSFVNTCLLRGA